MTDYTLFGSYTPGGGPDGDTSAVNLGIYFYSTDPGNVIGVRFYKSTDNTGTHIGALWSTGGSKLAEVTFTGETASGWQQMLFSPSYAVTPNTTYVISYHTDVGRYYKNAGWWSSDYTSGPLVSPSTGIGFGNGVYAYSSSVVIPSNATGAFYWVDVLFSTGSSGNLLNPQRLDGLGGPYFRGLE